MDLAHLRGKLLLSLALGVLVFAGLALYADFGALVQGAGHFRWEYLPLVLGLTLVNYSLRFVKWHYYLGQIGVHGVSPRLSVLLFFSGLSMVVTPGKLGEWLKTFLLRTVSGTPVSRSAPIVVAERLTDGLALLILGLGGLVVFGVGWEVTLATLGLFGGALAVVWCRPLANWLFDRGERLPGVGARARHLREFYESAARLLSPKNLSLAVGLGVASWSGECLAFYVVLQVLGVGPGPDLLLKAAFILATTTLAGALFLVPGGLGVAEGGIVALSQLLVGLSRDLAVVGALVIRFCTLWFGVAVGLVCLAVLSRRLREHAPTLDPTRGTFAS